MLQNLVLMPRWLRECPQPDLVTIWYAYKNWGIGTAALVVCNENPRACAIFAMLLRDYRTRAAPTAFGCFLNVLTATASDVMDVDRAVVRETDDDVAVSVRKSTVVFAKNRLESRVRVGPGQPSQP